MSAGPEKLDELFDKMRSLNRRDFLRLAAAGSIGTLIAACGPAATPTSAPQPAAAPKPTAAPAAQSGAPPTAASTAAAKADWQAKWNEVLAAAKKEGTVSVVGPPGDGFRLPLITFQQAYPDIKLEFQGLNGRDFGPKVLAERGAGQYLVDVHIGGTGTGNGQLKPNGVLDPIMPAIILPDVLDDSKWLGGFKAGWMDKETKFSYGFEANVRPVAYVNRDFVSESELSQLDQLLDPKWKGKMSWNDPRQNGNGASTAGHLLAAKGTDWLTKLYGQDVVVTADLRQQVEWAVRGTYPIAVGMDETSMVPFLDQGLGKNIKALDREGQDATRIEVGFGTVYLVNKAPHPNAAMVYLNWLLSKDGQTAWTKTLRASRRLDVTNPPDLAPDPKKTYRPTVNQEDQQEYQTKAQALAKQVLK